MDFQDPLQLFIFIFFLPPLSIILVLLFFQARSERYEIAAQAAQAAQAQAAQAQRAQVIAKRREVLLAALPPDLQPAAQWMNVFHLEEMHQAQLSLEHQRAVVHRQLDVGLPPEAVQIIWGPPHDVDRKGGKGGDVLIWTWLELGASGRKKIDKRVTFRDGGLKQWEDR